MSYTNILKKLRCVSRGPTERAETIQHFNYMHDWFIAGFYPTSFSRTKMTGSYTFLSVDRILIAWFIEIYTIEWNKTMSAGNYENDEDIDDIAPRSESFIAKYKPKVHAVIDVIRRHCPCLCFEIQDETMQYKQSFNQTCNCNTISYRKDECTCKGESSRTLTDHHLSVVDIIAVGSSNGHRSRLMQEQQYNSISTLIESHLQRAEASKVRRVSTMQIADTGRHTSIFCFK